ncbi:MAG TPA: hypothetical protein VJK48_00870 [Chlamydiales bacterium]|nr:hypothetical protein [Chlamydiales bacterium]
MLYANKVALTEKHIAKIKEAFSNPNARCDDAARKAFRIIEETNRLGEPSLTNAAADAAATACTYKGCDYATLFKMYKLFPRSEK